MTTINKFLTVFLLSAAAASAKEKPFAAVEQTVANRTRKEVRWEQDLRAREESRARARALLRKPLTVSSAVQVALLNNRGLQASFEEIGLSFADLREARQLANPEAELSVKFPDRPPTTPLYEWGIAQNFLNLLMLPLRTRVAREQLAAAQMRAADAVVKLIAEVKVAYYEVLADQQLSARMRTTRDAQGTSLELMQRLHEAGNVTDLALNQEQAQYARVRLEVAMAEADLRAKREKLNRLLGVWGSDTEWKLAATELPRPPADDVSVRALETLAVANRFDLAAARSSLASAVRAVGLEKTFRFIGALDFGVVGEHEPDGTHLTGPSLRLELPIFNQGQARIARGEAQLRMAAAKFEELAVETRSTVRELRDRLTSKRDMARFYREEFLPTRNAITEQTLVQYNAMLVGAFEAFTARREALEAERSAIEAVRDYWTTRAELERAVGGDLDGKRRAALPRTTTTSKTAKPLKTTKR
jgi:cobalt-zinc-cadmium efflux system outer membrane protein